MATKVANKLGPLSRFWGSLKRAVGLPVVQSEVYSPPEESQTEAQKDVDFRFHIVPLDEESRFIKDCLRAVKVSRHQAEEVADILVAADYRGIYPYGIHMLNSILDEIERKNINISAKPMILKQSLVVAWVNGKNALGPVVGNYCMNLAIKKAIQFGLGFVCVKGSNNIGMSSWYSMLAANEHLIGLVLTNDVPLMAAFNGVEPVLGSNSIACSAPANNDQFNMDMCCTNVSMERFEHHLLHNNQIPRNWILDDCGQPTKNAEFAHSLAPFGGYKGFGLAACIDILCGVLSGADYSTKVKGYGKRQAKDPANLGQVFIAIDPDAIQMGFQNRSQDFINTLRLAKPIDPRNPVRVPGDKELEHMRDVDQAGGIALDASEMRFYKELGARLNVKPLLYK